MRIVWQIDPEDVAGVLEFYELWRASPVVKHRNRQNLSDNRPLPSKDDFWHRMVACLLTTQQRSGPNSSVATFVKSKPFPLSLSECSQQPQLGQHAQKVLSDFGGLRRSSKIADELDVNLTYLKNDGWARVLEKLRLLQAHTSANVEREVAEFIDLNLKGFGPKQSRNLLQSLGLTRFEIPIDSRITKWLNNFGFPVTLNATALQDGHYYNFVSEGFQKLCAACNIVPCLLDAAIFVSYDNDKWTDENSSW